MPKGSLRTASLVELAPVLGIVALLLLSGGVAAGHLGSPGPVPQVSASSAIGAALPTSIKHVYVIMMENEGVDQVYGPLPYETKLAKEYAWGGDALTNPGNIGYYAVCHPSAPNYLGLTSGQSLQCGTDNYKPYPVNNIGEIMTKAGVSWVAYAESMPKACDTSSSGNYLAQHNPFPYYSDLVSSGVCKSHDLPMVNLIADFPYKATQPEFTWITPNDINDGHSSSGATGDTWLSKFVPKLMAMPTFSSSVIFVVYDESYGAKPDSGYNGLVGGPVYMVAVSPNTYGMGVLTTKTSHYNLLSTFEWLLALPATGTGHDGTSSFPAMKALFRTA